MPIYEYECQQCRKIHEAIQKFSDPPLKSCPECKGKLKKIMSLTSFSLKGTGYYSTDYKKPSQQSAEMSESKAEAKQESTATAPACKTGCGHNH